ncbi:PHD finger protein 20-like protein 1 isoform X3 [Scleropages formosus]|uniref:PHD finger protein 20-like protein 1 isoform X3 n=1 Tax=Scleropages formosus TaxID=113540 RepID=UPI00087877DD|nr:PHD finger protein 20-like protein 1 isoform X3 [Scleropages formosus]
MSKKPPNRPGITFEVGAKIEAQDYLHKWYPSHIEKIDYEEGKMLVHFDRWSHRYDEWIYWDSSRLRPLQRPALRKEGLKEEDEMVERLSEMTASRHHELPGSTESTEDQTELPQSRQDLRSGEEVLARWTDCRYYPAKIESISKEGSYTVQFYDGVVRCVKRMHIKSMLDDSKGQDWNALVKAATAKDKPRTSASSNRDHEESSEDGDPEDEELEVTQMPATLKPISKEDPKRSPGLHETVRCRKEKEKIDASCNTKGMRFPKMRASKGAEDDISVRKEDQGNAVGLSDERRLVGTHDESPVGLTEHPITPTTTSPTKLRCRRLKHTSGEPIDSPRQLKAMVEEESTRTEIATPSVKATPIVTATALHTASSTLQPSDQSQQRRRSQRLAMWAPSIPMGNTPPASTSRPHETGSEVLLGETSMPSVQMAPDSPFLAENSKPATDLNIDVPAVTNSSSVALPLETPQLPVTEVAKETDSPTPSRITIGEKLSEPTAVAGLKTACRNPKANKHAREPIMNTIKSEGGTSHKDSFFDLDHNKFSCKVPGCSKAFRKAKLLDYHLKYYHNAEKEFEAGPSGKVGRTRAISTSVPGSTPFESIDSTRRRTVSTSAFNLCAHTHVLPSLAFSAQSHLQLDSCGIGVKPTKTDKKKRSSASFSSDGSESLLLVPNQEQTSDTLHDKILKKVIEKDKYLDLGLIQPEKKMKLEETCQPIGKKKDKERKDKKDHFKVKQKKKKKKKKSKQHNLSDFEDLPLSLLERCSSPCRPFTPQGNASSKLTAFQYPRAILSVDLTGENLSDIDFLEDSSTESLFLSGDEYGQDLDSFTMDDFQEEDNEEQGASREIVRCICEMDDENGFMIQCEECMCWQHSVCVGLLEDCVPDLYICYMCRDPPGQRWSAKYQHSKEWLNKGHMYGLPFLSENYSHQNAKKIVSTHQLLADVFSVKKVLHGLQLKMDILQRKHSPSLHLWARSWVKSDEDKTMVNCPNHILIQGQLSDGRSCYPSLDNYITSEHSYQKPLGLGLDPWSSTISEGRSNWEPAVPFGLKEEKSGCLGDPEVDSSGQGRSCLQLQLNLLNHVEDVQKQVARRMDLIEKELDVLENWLDFTGELEPPDPLARLPQLKWRMKQLLNDLVKVQQMGSLFSI